MHRTDRQTVYNRDCLCEGAVNFSRPCGDLGGMDVYEWRGVHKQLGHHYEVSSIRGVALAAPM